MIVTEERGNHCEKFARINSMVCTLKLFFHGLHMEIVQEIQCADPLNHFRVRRTLNFIVP